jgi:small subunit ribosomal protein S5
MFDRKTGWEYRVVEIKRVTRVTRGGKRFKIRAVVIAGNKNGKVGIGVEKGDDVSQAVNKALNSAIKNSIDVPIINKTIPYTVEGKVSAAKVLIKPAKEGKGLVAGGTVRIVLELAGVENAISKIIGVTKNPLTNALSAIEALKKLNKYIKIQENVNQPDKV